MRLVCRQLCHKSMYTLHTPLLHFSRPRICSFVNEKRTDDPCVVNCVLTAIKLNSEDSDLIGASLCLVVFWGYGLIIVFLTYNYPQSLEKNLQYLFKVYERQAPLIQAMQIFIANFHFLNCNTAHYGAIFFN